MAIINTNPARHALRLHLADQRGLIIAEVRDRAGRLPPVLLIATYIPPRSSVLADVRGPILAKIALTIQRARATYGNNIIIAGDLNTSLPRLHGAARATADTSHS